MTWLALKIGQKAWEACSTLGLRSPVVAVGGKQGPRQVFVEPAEAGRARERTDSCIHVNMLLG